MQNAIFQVLKYFSQFRYAPTAQEIHTFLPQKTSRKNVIQELDRLVTGANLYQKSFVALGKKITGYTTVSSFDIKNQRKRFLNSQQKRGGVKRYLGLLSWAPFIELVGLSGSVAMQNATSEADVDLFIIARKSRLWSARFVALALAALCGVRRTREAKNSSNKVCLNLFFDEQDLQLPADKHTVYAAHEVLQMKPLFMRNNTYAKFLAANGWVAQLFPNGPSIAKKREVRGIKNSLVFDWGEWGEWVLKTLQLYFINRHRTTERITPTQLWFFPDDYEKKIRKRL